jgi:hypothetical protein
MAINLGPEPEGALIRRADIFAWLPGLSARQWKKIRPTLNEVCLNKDSHSKPYYRKEEVRQKIVKQLTVSTT